MVLCVANVQILVLGSGALSWWPQTRAALWDWLMGKERRVSEQF